MYYLYIRIYTYVYYIYRCITECLYVKICHVQFSARALLVSRLWIKPRHGFQFLGQEKTHSNYVLCMSESHQLEYLSLYLLLIVRVQPLGSVRVRMLQRIFFQTIFAYLVFLADKQLDLMLAFDIFTAWFVADAMVPTCCANQNPVPRPGTKSLLEFVGVCVGSRHGTYGR